MTLFRTVIPEALLKFVTILNKIIWGQDLSTGPQKLGMTKNLIVGEALRVIEKNNWDNVTENNANYELATKF